MRSASRPATANQPEIDGLVVELAKRREKTEVELGIGREIYRIFESSSGPRVDGLHFYVFEGGISVYGAVATYEQRDAVMTALSSVPGITQIADHLTVLS